MIEINVSLTADTQAIWLVFIGDKIIQTNDNDEPMICSWAELDFAHAYQEQVVKIGQHQDLPCYLIDMGNETIDHDQLVLISMRSLLAQSHTDFFGIAARAWQITLFMRTHRFCGQCGCKMQQIDWEMAMQCSRCTHRCYPRISPCIIVAIKRDKRILLAQGKPQQSRNMYSVLAGFVESGETLEQAVHREVFEEVSIRIKNLRYFSSQPWPFPHSLMVGFLADYDQGEIQVDGKEILEANWYSIDELPNTPPKLSIAGQLIEHSLKEIQLQQPIPTNPS
ncbi:NAD(+) diphosphatase [Paraglaciecola aestuariivivens]